MIDVIEKLCAGFISPLSDEEIAIAMQLIGEHNERCKVLDELAKILKCTSYNVAMRVEQIMNEIERKERLLADLQERIKEIEVN